MAGVWSLGLSSMPLFSLTYNDNVVCVLCRLLGCIRINLLLSWSILLGLLMSGTETCVCVLAAAIFK